MNPQAWVHRFEQNRDKATEPDWSTPCSLTSEQRSLLAQSLAIFQVGETGGGTRLRRFVRREANFLDDPATYLQAVDLFIAEEQRHAALLAKMVKYLGGELRSKHWTNRVFRRVRGLVNLEFNIQVLLTAELIAEAYYGFLSRHGDCPVIREACSRIVRDEVLHISFHQDFFRARQSHWLPLQSHLWSLQFQAIFATVKRVVWVDHGRALESIGVTRQMYHHQANRVCRSFLRRLDRLPTTSPDAQEKALVNL